MNKSSSRQGFWLISAVYVCTFSQMLDTSIANLALIVISNEFNIDVYNAKWVISAYLLGMTIAFSLTKVLSEKYGQNELFRLCMISFLVSSLICGLSQDIETLLVFRLLQGCCSGILLLLSQNILIGIYGEDKKNYAISMWTSAITLAPIFGPLIGGYITDTFGWEFIFLINIPLTAYSYIILERYLISKKMAPAKLDKTMLYPIAFFIIFIVSFQSFLDFGDLLGWFKSSLTHILFVTSILSAALFLCINKQTPLFDFNILKNVNFTLSMLMLTLGHAINFATLIILPFWLMRTYNAPLLETGLLMSINGIISVLITPLIGKIKKIEYLKVLSLISLGLMIVVFYMMTHFSISSSMTYIVMSRVILGAALSLFYTPFTAVCFNKLGKNDLLNANSISLIFRMLMTGIILSISYLYLKNKKIILLQDINSSIAMLANKNEHGYAILSQLAQTLTMQHFSFICMSAIMVMFFILASFYLYSWRHSLHQRRLDNPILAN